MPKAAQVDAIIPRRRAWREFLGCSITTGYRHENNNPEWPKVIKIGPGRYGYRLSDIQRYIDTRPLAKDAA